MEENAKVLLEQMRKKIKGLNVTLMSESPIANRTEFIKTPALDLNRILSGDLYKGIPQKTLVGITGPEHSFKSSFSCLCAADAAKERGYTPVIIDTEGGLTTDFCKRWGLDVSNAIYMSEIWLEKIIPFLVNLKETGFKKMIIILDSIGGLDRFKTYKDAVEDDVKQDQGQLQRSIRTLMKLLLHICMTTDSIGIFTAHLMSRPGMVPMPDDVAGGKAVKLFPSIFIWLKKESMKRDEKECGSRLVATTMKNRFYPPFQEATIDIDYQKGINTTAGLLELLMPDKANILKKEGNTYVHVKSGEKYAVYDSAAEKKLASDTMILDALNDWLKTTGYSTVNENVRAAEELLEEIEEENTETKKQKKKTRVTAKKKIIRRGRK